MRICTMNSFALQVIEVWEWVVKHRIFDPFPNFPDGFCTLLIFYASAHAVIQGGLVSRYTRFPSIVEEALFLRGRRTFAR